MTTYKKDIDVLNDVKLELNRFVSKLDLAIVEQSNPKNYSHMNMASAKRSALDLKRELTKLTQIANYKYKS
jgi:hypothetical protein